MAPRFPSPESVSGPAPLRPPGGLAIVDTTGLEQGVQNLARGVSQFGAAAKRIGNTIEDKQRVADFSKAEATWTAGAIELGNRMAASKDYGRMGSDTDRASQELKAKAAELIRDPEAREEWLSAAEIKRLHLVDGATDRARMLSEENDRVEFGNSLKTSALIIADPTIDEGTRGLARKQIENTIQAGLQSELILPGEANKFRLDILDPAEQQLALNRAQLQILRNPQDAQRGVAIPLADHTATIADAALGVAGGTMAITPEMARIAAPRIGDTALPQDDKLAEAYLKDPEINARYAQGVMDALTERYNGDITAAVIASAPGGSLALAEKWVKSGHSEAALPKPVREYYRKVMSDMVPEQALVRTPLIAGPGVDLAKFDVGVLERFENLQAAFGTDLPIVSDAADVTGRSMAVDISDLSEEERLRLIAQASALGFTGIGIDDETLHLDAGDRRAVGKVPAYAAEAMSRHLDAQFTVVEPTLHAVAPEYAALTFDQRMRVHADAQAAIDAQAIDVRAGIEVAVQNAPVALMSTGRYDGIMPTVDDFVHGWGAAEGIERWKAFDAAVESAETAYGMRTMSSEEIAAAVEAAVPRETGDMAAVANKRFEVISSAAESTMSARKDDPAGYVMQTFPNVAAAWKGVEQNPSSFPAALTAMAEAQTSLGLEMELLPAKMAEQTAATFNDAEQPQADRIAAVEQIVLATPDRGQQEALLRQLVKAGVPSYTEGAFAALAAGRRGSASYLFRAAMTDPDKLPGKLDYTGAEIDQKIMELIFDENQIGNVTYGVTDGTAENFDRALADGLLIERAVKLRLFDGSATTLDQAVELSRLDLFGEKQVVAGKPYAGGAGMRITLPVGEDRQPYEMGFNALRATVGEAMMADLTPAIAQFEGFAERGGSGAAILAFARDNYIATVLDEGYFANGPDDDSFVFIDPKVGAFVPGPDGEPMIFSKQDVLEAGMAADATRRANRPVGYPSMTVEGEEAFHKRMEGIYGSSYRRPLANP